MDPSNGFAQLCAEEITGLNAKKWAAGGFNTYHVTLRGLSEFWLNLGKLRQKGVSSDCVMTLRDEIPEDSLYYSICSERL